MGITIIDETKEKCEDYDIGIDKIWDDYFEDMKSFAEKGDERDYVPSYEENIKELEDELIKDDTISKKERRSLLNRIKAKKKEAKKIEGLAEDHRLEMQRHSSGSSYHMALAKLEEAIGL